MNTTYQNLLPNGKKKSLPPYILNLANKCPKKCHVVKSSCFDCPFDVLDQQLDLFGGAL